MNTYDDTTVNLLVLGDEVVNGYGDESHLGSIRRILRASDVAKEINLNLIEVGIKGASSTELSEQSSDIIKTHLPGVDQNRLIIFMPNRDIDSINISRSRLNLANILDRLNVSNLRVMVVGPAPRGLDDNIDIGELTRSLRDVCSRRNVQFVDIFTPLYKDSQWIHSMLSSEGKYTNKVGYGLVAWLIQESGFARFLQYS